MSNENAIEVFSVSKKFKVHSEKNNSLKEKIIYRKRSKWREYVALDNVSFNVKKGSTIAIIGKNGSGKSTLLKLISKIIYPDNGYIRTYGKVSSLLELGAGFHPEFSGIENIFMNASLLGFTKTEIKKKLDYIIDFSELKEFINEPVRSYSSGMYMRLAFSIAVAVDPEILLVDEILSVGDAAFQTKGIARIRELQKQNKTIVMVTHDSNMVENYCDEVIWLQDSKIFMNGNPIEIVPIYLEKIFKTLNNANYALECYTNNELETDNSIKITNIYYNDTLDNISIRCGDGLTVKFEIFSKTEFNELTFAFEIISDTDKLIFKSNTYIDKVKIENINVGSWVIECKFINFNLISGSYKINGVILSENGAVLDKCNSRYLLGVYNDHGDSGIIRLDHQWIIV
jgi:ABC-type polysaccharide/polyol phosphate transport system ATPase subunit